MSGLTVVGGIYYERCVWPVWDQVFGSGGRAAVALSGHAGKLLLRGYADPQAAARFGPWASISDFDFEPVAIPQSVLFDYYHCLSTPAIYPSVGRIRVNTPIPVADEVVLRFGMIEGTAVVDADRCVYDPQSAFAPELFQANGSRAAHLAIVANRAEIVAMGGHENPVVAAQGLLKEGAEVVVIKSGVEGCWMVDELGEFHVPAFQSKTVWTIGSGDVFAAMFAALWGVRRELPRVAARSASQAVAAYAATMSLPVPVAEDPSSLVEATLAKGRVYLAGPFFNISQRWLIEESRRLLLQMGLEVFSPIHDVGSGPGEVVGPADLAAVDSCDVMFAILDGLDPGTVFEVGYARARGKPVYALAQSVSNEDLKMIIGSDCRTFVDFATAIHHVAWRT